MLDTDAESDMGGTAFSSEENGNVEIARTVDRERFYRILKETLNS